MRITAHLGLKIPKTEDKFNSYIRVEDQIYHWKDGELFLFDDSFEHEVWHYNERNESRLILIFHFRHPDMKLSTPIPALRFDQFGHYVKVDK